MTRTRIASVRIVPVLVALAALTACGGGSDSATQTASPSAPASMATAPGAPTAAACNEVNRLTRQEIDGLTDRNPTHWQAFAVSLQDVANVSADAEFRQALTDLATAALATSEELSAGTPGGKATAGFLDAVPAVDHLCKLAGAPLI